MAAVSGPGGSTRPRLVAPVAPLLSESKPSEATSGQSFGDSSLSLRGRFSNSHWVPGEPRARYAVLCVGRIDTVLPGAGDVREKERERE